ncbi:MAG: glycosyltransferase family 2 protein [Marinicellaceae bacterium]
MPLKGKLPKPLLTIILPAFNVEKYIEQCISSILNQTFKNFELIIADDCSTDNTKNIINSIVDDRIIVTHNQSNLGKTKTVNKIFAMTNGKYITVHDSDDWSDLTRFEKQIDWLEKSEDRIMCGTGYQSYNSNNEIIENFVPLVEYNDIKNAIKFTGQFHGPTIVFKKDSLDGELIYRKYFNDNYEDTDLAYRMFQKGICSNLTEPLFFYRILPNSLCRNQYTIRNSQLYKVVVHLAQQRETFGEDDLMKNDIDSVDKYFNKITEHYKYDKGLIYREGASYYLYWKYYKKAINYSLKSIIVSPFNLKNIRTLFYCLRKSIKNVF